MSYSRLIVIKKNVIFMSYNIKKKQSCLIVVFFSDKQSPPLSFSAFHVDAHQKSKKNCPCFFFFGF